MPITEAAVENPDAKLFADAEALMQSAPMFQVDAARLIDDNQKEQLKQAVESIRAKLTLWQANWLLNKKLAHNSAGRAYWVPEVQNLLDLWPQMHQFADICKQVATVCGSLAQKRLLGV